MPDGEVDPEPEEPLAGPVAPGPFGPDCVPCPELPPPMMPVQPAATRQATAIVVGTIFIKNRLAMRPPQVQLPFKLRFAAQCSQ